MSNTSSTSSKMPLTMFQKEQAWTTWWAARPLFSDDGSQSAWEKERSVLREKKNWWFYTYGERYWTLEDKEEQWRNYWEGAHGEGSEPHDGAEKRQWWRQTFKEDPPLSRRQIELARQEEIAAARVRNQEDREKDARMGFYGPAAALAAALRQKTAAMPEAVPQAMPTAATMPEPMPAAAPADVPEAMPEPAALRSQVEAIAASSGTRAAYLPRPPIENPVLFGCPCCANIYSDRLSCDGHIKAEHGAHTKSEAVVMFHPRATEEELKACLFANLPWQDRVLLNGTVGSRDMDLCYVTKKLVFRAPEEDGDGH